MGISKELADAVAKLRKAVQAASQEMSQTPGADEVNLLIEDLSKPDISAYLQFDAGGTNAFYVCYDTLSTSRNEDFADLELTNQLKVAEQIPNFIDKAKEKCELRATDIEQLAVQIVSTLDKYKQVTNGSSESNGPDTRSNRKRATKKA